MRDFISKKLSHASVSRIEIERPARPVTIYRLEVEKISFPEVEFYLECSKGTYVRQLAEDIGKVLGCGACVSKIDRTQVGEFNLENSVTIEESNESHIRDWQGAQSI